MAILETMPDSNSVLDGLTAAELDTFPGLERIDLRPNDVIDLPDGPFANAYFPIDAILSMTTVMKNGDEVETMTIGYEGFYPIAILFNAKHCSNRTVCQVAGSAYRMPIEAFVDGLSRYPALRERADAFGRAALQSLAQSIACNRLHPLVERCARWLLMTHDRVRGAEFRLTQEYLAVMLGVRRPAVSVAAQTLQNAGLIVYRRGTIKVVDRVGLEASSCECYRVVTKAYEPLMGDGQ